ncbi:MAG: PilZ domain-containing protein [Planctomycetales bacterium]|nr:PilZ domain-containing protein [Planctomycetales bacterium]
MVLSVESYSPEQVDAAARVLEKLAALDDRRDPKNPRRDFTRRPYHRVISIQHEQPTANQKTSSPKRCHVLARNISQGGLSFVYPGRLDIPRLLVSPSGPGSEYIWFRAEVVRVREVEDGFWEYGVSFRGRVEVVDPVRRTNAR